MKIGGLQEKIIAAKAIGIDIILCPMSNLSEVLEFPPALLEGLHVLCIKKFASVYSLAFQQSSICKEGVTIVTEKGILQPEDTNQYLEQEVFHKYYALQQQLRQSPLSAPEQTSSLPHQSEI